MDSPDARAAFAGLLFDSVPALAPAERAEMFRHTFDPATPDPPAGLLIGDDVLAGTDPFDGDGIFDDVAVPEVNEHLPWSDVDSSVDDGFDDPGFGDDFGNPFPGDSL
ncbi:hypothetical protein ACFQ1L_23255 [Phytohabitans flavus]|uniref:hypothetical protein n=1 Tax=Phytohabitans flavus TaxID=1076124 RepID=UPI00363C7F66